MIFAAIHSFCQNAKICYNSYSVVSTYEISATSHLNRVREVISTNFNVAHRYDPSASVVEGMEQGGIRAPSAFSLSGPRLFAGRLSAKSCLTGLFSPKPAPVLSSTVRWSKNAALAKCQWSASKSILLYGAPYCIILLSVQLQTLLC